MAGLDSNDFSHSPSCTDEYDVFGGYVPSFVQHLKDTGARLGIGVGLQDNEGLISACGTVGEAADAPPFSNWTPAEHDTFFRALSVYSRWRPDLIAACVPTKTEWEVWMYLDALEEGAAALAAQHTGEDVDVEASSGDERQDAAMQVDAFDSDADSRSDTDTDEVCEPALEVSQTWIDVEERMASWIVEKEHLVSVEGDAVADAEDAAPRKRKRGRPRGAGRGRVRSRARPRAGANESRRSLSRADRSPPSDRSLMSARNTSQEPSDVSEQRREVLMGHLGVAHLLVLDTILREGEEAMKEKNKSREGSVAETTPTEFGEDEEHCEVPSLSDQTIVPQETSKSPSNMVIDPVLLAMSGEHHSDGRDTLVPPSAQGFSALHHASSQPPPLELFLQSGATTMFTFPSGDTTRTSPDPAANAEPDLSMFSPRSRRRIQKRLYMRRKRALSHGNSKGVLDTGVEKLKPGKKAKSERKETPGISAEAPDAEAETTENVRRKNKGGLTLPYKLRAQFAELGIDAGYLCSQGMDLLNLSALGRLMGLCASLEHEEEESAMSIDAQLLRHLQAAVVSFVTDITHRAIVWREREIRLKQRSQAWRQGDHMTVTAIEHAVAAIGARYHSHKEYFKSLGLSTGEPDHAKTPSVDGEAADLSPELPQHSPHWDMYTPLIRPPSGWRIGALSCLARTYEPETVGGDVLSDETDEEALAAELADEAAVDAEDMAQAGAVESVLWAGVRRTC